MDELLQTIAGVDEEDDLLVRILSARWPGTALELTIKVSVDDGDELGEWSIRCRHLLTQRLGSEAAFSLELTDDHPSLWAFKYPNASAFFSGVPANSQACVGALYQAHEGAVRGWLDFGYGVNPTSHIADILR